MFAARTRRSGAPAAAIVRVKGGCRGQYKGELSGRVSDMEGAGCAVEVRGTLHQCTVLLSSIQGQAALLLLVGPFNHTRKTTALHLELSVAFYLGPPTCHAVFPS
eukprot:2567493-Rhodomonas_salina.1